MGAVKRRAVREEARRPVTGRRLLLDTHALLWWLTGDRRLPARARRAIGDSAAQVFVSAVSAWEIATKRRLGRLDRLDDPRGVLDSLVAHVAEQGFTELSISLEHGMRAGNLPGPHQDPFDRMLIAQAQAEGLGLVSNEAAFDAYGVTRVW